MIDSGVVNATQEMAIDWLREHRRFVQALLIEVEGSAPLPEGAMMVIDEDGQIEGSITGGCVEGAVVTEAEAILAGERGPGVLTYGISDELAGTVGLMCGGIVHIFISEPSGADAQTELAALEAHADGRPAAMATLLDGEDAGARLAVVDEQVLGRCADPNCSIATSPARPGTDGGGQDDDSPFRRRRRDARRRAARPYPLLRAAPADVHHRRD